MKAALGRAHVSGQESIEQKVWEQTKDEVAGGWLRGPCTEGELVDQLGQLFVISRRFGLQQGQKVRMIDDLREPLVNAAFGAAKPSTCEE